MFSKKEYARNLLGCFEIMLFMRQGLARFSPERKDAIKSFIWPLLLIPVALFAFSFQAAGYSLSFMMILHALRMIIAMGLFLGAVYFVCRQYERKQYFWQFLNALNWLNIPLFILMLPIVLSLFQIYGTTDAQATYAELAGSPGG